jgi:hypothetical protein
MRRLAVFLIGIFLTTAGGAQPSLTFTTSGGLTAALPERYLAAEIGPLHIGLTDRESGASILFAITDSAQAPEEALAAEFRRLGIAADQIQSGALNARTANGRITGARAVRASGSVMIASVAFADGMLGLLTIQPSDSVPLPVLKSFVESIRVARQSAANRYPLCGSEALPRALTTSGGLTICFPGSFAGEEKGANAAGLADLAGGVIVSIYARGDLQSLIGQTPSDARTAAAAMADMLRLSGALPVESAIQQLQLDSGPAVAMPVAYPGVGSGRLIAAESAGGIVVVSAVLIGLPPADVVFTLDAIVNSVALGEPTGDLGAVQPADVAVDLGVAVFTAQPGWSLVSLDGGLAALEREAGTALMSVAAAPLDSSWNAAAYTATVLPVAAQFAGDVAFDATALESIAPGIVLYDSSLTVPAGTGAVNLTALITIDDRAFVVFQANSPRDVYTPSVRDEVLAMARSAR